MRTRCFSDHHTSSRSTRENVMLTLKFAAVAATACTLIASASAPVHAAGPKVQVLSVAGPGCASGVFLMRVKLDGIDPAAPVAVHTIVRSGGLASRTLHP